MTSDLYTSVVEYAGGVFINQFFYNGKNLIHLLQEWRSVVVKKIIHNKQDKMLLERISQEEYEYEYEYELEQLVTNKKYINVWWTLLSAAEDNPANLAIIKTDTQIIGGTRNANLALESKYDLYRSKYAQLKTLTVQTNDIRKEGKKLERQMKYWQEKELLSIQNLTGVNILYTFVLEYLGDLLLHQFYLRPGDTLDSLLSAWRKKFISSNILGNEEDNRLLAEKLVKNVANKGIYELVRLKNVRNVWGTYFTLSRGLASVIVVQTA